MDSKLWALIEELKTQNTLLKHIIDDLNDKLNALEDDSPACDCANQHILASFLIEIGHEVAHTQLTEDYKTNLIGEITKAIIQS